MDPILLAGKWGLEQFSATVDAKERVESPPYTLGTEKNEAVVLFLLLKSVSDSGWWIFAKYDSDILKKSFFPRRCCLSRYCSPPPRLDSPKRGIMKSSFIKHAGGKLFSFLSLLLGFLACLAIHHDS